MNAKKINASDRNVVPGGGVLQNTMVKAGDFNPLVDDVAVIEAAIATIDNLVAPLQSTGGILMTTETSETPAATHTINAPSGSCIVTHGATAALGTLEVTITNSLATATSIVLASINTYGGNGTPLVKEVTPSAGSIVIEIYNAHASAALSANFGLVFAILG